MSNYREVLINGEKIRKHVRDIAKDAVIRAMLPQGRLRLYEASAGLSLLARELRQDGHDVVVSNYRLRGITGVEEIEADLNGSVPLPDASFDAVICREVIEHVESIPHTLREFQRLLKPGGTLILTLPNRLQFRSRLYHLFTGFYRGMRSPINLDVPLGEAHINLVGYPEMDYFLRKTGFALDQAATSQIQRMDYAFLALRPLVRLLTRHFLLRARKRAEEHDKTRPENIRYNTIVAENLLSDAVFLGKVLILRAHRAEQVL